MRRSLEKWWSLLATLGIALCAIWLMLAGLLKWFDLADFQAALEMQRVFVGQTLAAAAKVIPPAQLLIGTLALYWVSTHRLKLSASLLAGMFLMMSMYLFWIQWHPPLTPTSCGCGFSRAIVENWGMLGLENAVIALGLAFAAMTSKSIHSIRPVRETVASTQESSDAVQA